MNRELSINFLNKELANLAKVKKTTTIDKQKEVIESELNKVVIIEKKVKDEKVKLK